MDSAPNHTVSADSSSEYRVRHLPLSDSAWRRGESDIARQSAEEWPWRVQDLYGTQHAYCSHLVQASGHVRNYFA